MPEILPLHARAKGTAIGISSNWLWVSRTMLKTGGRGTDSEQNFVVVMITPTLINKVSDSQTSILLNRILTCP